MKIKLKDLLNEESPAAKQAKAKGLTSKGFGNWADSSGKVTHQSKNGQLVPTKEPKEPKVKAKKKKVKPKKSSSTLNPEKHGLKPPSDDVKKRIKSYKKPDEWNADNVKPVKDKKNNVVGFVDPASGQAIDAPPEAQEKIKKELELRGKEDLEKAMKNVYGDDRSKWPDTSTADKPKKEKPKKEKPKKTKSKPELSAKERERKAIKQAERKKKEMKSGGSWQVGGKSVADGWDDMLDSADGLTKSWWEDLMTSFEKEAGELEK